MENLLSQNLKLLRSLKGLRVKMVAEVVKVRAVNMSPQLRK